MFKGWHHLHRRKRIHVKHEPYPHPDVWKNRMDRMMIFIGMMGPIMAIPQLFAIWVDKTASGVSPITWSAFLVLAVVWLIYGLMHKAKPIITTYTAWIIMNSLIVTGVLLY